MTPRNADRAGPRDALEFRRVACLRVPQALGCPNECAWFVGRRGAGVVDARAAGQGRRALPDAPSDAAWFADVAARRLRALTRDAAADGRSLLRQATTDVDLEFKGRRAFPPGTAWEAPHAALAAVRLRADGRLEFLRLADCIGILVPTFGPARILGGLQDILPDGKPAADAPETTKTGAAPHVHGGRWVLGGHPDAADAAARTQAEVSVGDRLLLATGGFRRAADPSGLAARHALADRLRGGDLEGLTGRLGTPNGAHASDPDASSMTRGCDACVLLLEIVCARRAA